MNTPIIGDILATHEQGFELRGWVDMGKLATELLALRAERERLEESATESRKSLYDLRGKLQSLATAVGVITARYHSDVTMTSAIAEAVESWRKKAEATPTPPRRLREWKGVAYREDHAPHAWRYKGEGYDAAFMVMANHPYDFTDADHAALLALRDDPEEPVETLESIIEPALTRSYVAGEGRSGGTWIGTEQLSEDVAEQIRAHLAQQPQAITPEQAVAVLVEAGAERRRVNMNGTMSGTWTKVEPDLRDALILPTATPEGGK